LTENAPIFWSAISATPRAVRSLDGWELADDELVSLGQKVKAVLQDGKAILLVMPSGRHVDGPQWRTCNKEILKSY